MQKTANKIRISKTPALPRPKDDVLRIILLFVNFAKNKLKMNDHNINIRLLHAGPDINVTTGCYDPNNDQISVITQNRNPIDYCRTIAHEMVHQRQKYQNRLNGQIQEIGGEIEDEANYMSGRVVKEFIKTVLTNEQKKLLGLGGF